MTEQEKEIIAEKYAYDMCGSCPCEDCDEFRHEENISDKMWDCLENGGCMDKEAYDHDIAMYKEEYLKRVYGNKF